jgi:hypothetical protein
MSLAHWSAACSLLALTAVHAQKSEPDTASPVRAPVPAAPADVKSAEAIVKAAYDVISGPAGTPRNWQRFYSLFTPGARLIPTSRGQDGVPHLAPVTPQEFVRQATEYFATKPFYEGEIGRSADTFGAITQVFSAYASRHAPDDPAPFERGINSFQLFNDGTRYYIVTIYWDDETSGHTIPSRYLNRADAHSK